MWIKLTDEQKLQVLQQLENAIGLPAFVVEKDWWVCAVLKAVFQSKYAGSIIFKGGTSLSKAYNLIDHFSEDIDLIIDRHLLGFNPSKAIRLMSMTNPEIEIQIFRTKQILTRILTWKVYLL